MFFQLLTQKKKEEAMFFQLYAMEICNFLFACELASFNFFHLAATQIGKFWIEIHAVPFMSAILSGPKIDYEFGT